MALGWQVPTATVNNSFSVTLAADGALTGVDISDFRLKGVDNSTLPLDTNNTTLTQVDTHRWRLDIALTGTYDADHFVRVRRNQVQEDGANVPSSFLDSSTFRIDSSFTPPPPPPAIPVISQIATPLNFIVNTQFRLTVTITGIDTSAGDTVEVLGLLERFAYAFAGTTLTITGTPERLLSNATLKIVATKNGGTPIERDAIFNVVLGGPVIGAAAAPPLYRGLPYSFFVPIVNRPPKPTVAGLQTGLIYERAENAQGDKGVLISGTVAPGDFTVDSGEFIVNAPYAGGPVSRTFPHRMGTATFYGNTPGNPSTIRRIELNGDGEDITSDLSFTIPLIGGRGAASPIAVDADYLYRVINLSPRSVYRFPRNTGDGHSTSGESLTTLSSNNWYGVAVGGSHLYAFDATARRIHVRDKSNGNSIRSFSVPSTIGNATNSAIDLQGDRILILVRDDAALYFVDEDTANNGSADITKTLNLPASGNYYDLVVVGSSALITDNANDQIHLVDLTGDDGSTVELLASYDVPSGFRDLQGIAAYFG